jgi:two-component system NtrC family sensor kinase
MQAVRALVTAVNRQWKRTAYPLQFACVVFPAVLFLGLAWIDYQVELERTRQEVMTTTGALAEHAQTVIETADLVLARVLDHIDGADWATLRASVDTHRFLARLRDELPQVEAVYLVDPDGRLAASSRGFPMPRYDLHTAAYFAEARAQDGDGTVITTPPADTRSGTHGFMVSRRRMRDGGFDGVVAVTVSQQYFETFYRAILNHLTTSAAGLIRTDGHMLVRFPDPPSPYPQVLPASNGMMRLARAGHEFAVFEDRSSTTGAERIGGFRRLHGLPLLVGFSIDRSVFLTTWATHAAVIGVCAILLSALLLATESLVRRKTAIEHDALRRLVAETERRRQAEAMAQQSQKMEALGRLTGGVAHDFNNLLAVILASLELVLRREKEPRAVRLLQTATQAAERGAKLTAQMLAFSRKHEVAVRPVDVNAVIEGMDDLLRRTLGPSVRLHYDLGAAEWPVLADRVQLEMALLNLAVNARDAMPNGGSLTFRSEIVAVGDRSVSDLPPGPYVRVQVADTGVGMSAEVLSRANEPFYTTKAVGSGTGLGLSMVYGFVRELGGAVTLESSEGVGTTVSLYLRRAERAVMAEAMEPERGAPVRTGRLLVVDDDASVRLAIREMLEEMGHVVVEADGGAEALAVLEGDRGFDLLVVDFAMPLMTGGQLASEVVRLWPAAPILFVTGYVENDALQPWSEQGYGTVQKPFGARDLASAVERSMRLREPTAV